MESAKPSRSPLSNFAVKPQHQCGVIVRGHGISSWFSRIDEMVSRAASSRLHQGSDRPASDVLRGLGVVKLQHVAENHHGFGADDEGERRGQGVEVGGFEARARRGERRFDERRAAILTDRQVPAVPLPVRAAAGANVASIRRSMLFVFGDHAVERLIGPFQPVRRGRRDRDVGEALSATPGIARSSSASTTGAPPRSGNSDRRSPARSALRRRPLRGSACRPCFIRRAGGEQAGPCAYGGFDCRERPVFAPCAMSGPAAVVG